MELNDLERLIREKEGRLSLAYPALMRKVYLWMTLALVITGVTAYGVASSPILLQTIFSSKIIFFGIIIGELILVATISGAIHKLSAATATLLFTLYSVLNGATLSIILLAYSPTIIAKVFLITAGMFVTMAIIGYTTRKDLSSMGRLLFMALVGLIIATVVNLFLKSSGLDLIMSYAGVIIFAGLTAWDTQKIKTMLAQCEEMDEGAQKIALLGALTLYLDFINLFLYLLRIFGKISNNQQ